MEQEAAPSKPLRWRWFQFRLTTILLLTLAVAICMAFYASEQSYYERQSPTTLG